MLWERCEICGKDAARAMIWGSWHVALCLAHTQAYDTAVLPLPECQRWLRLRETRQAMLAQLQGGSVQLTDYQALIDEYLQVTQALVQHYLVWRSEQKPST